MGKKSPPKTPPASAAFLPEEMTAMVEARDRATQNTPSVVREALLGQPIVIGGVTVPVIMLGHVLLLEKIGSPFVKLGQGEPTNVQVTEALFVLNKPAAEVLRLLRAGRAAFDDAVLEFAATAVRLADMHAIGAALGAQLIAAHSTVIGSSDSPASSGEGTGADHAEKKSRGEPAPVTSPDKGLLQKQTASAGS